MNILYLLILLIITGSSIINSIKWGRFAQREHYLPGSVTRFYFRWVRTSFVNKFLFFISLILFVISLWLYFVPIFVIILTLLTPVGISFNTRTGDVNITERLQRVNSVSYTHLTLPTIYSV